jgi:hypothetical protein
MPTSANAERGAKPGVSSTVVAAVGLGTAVVGGLGYWFASSVLSAGASYDNAFVSSFNPEFANRMGTFRNLQTFALFVIGVGILVMFYGLFQVRFASQPGAPASAPTSSTEAVAGSSDSAACPLCAEIIKVAAVKCRYCGADLSPGWANKRA